MQAKKKKKKTKPLTKRELQQYFPDLYELKYGNISELEIEKKELESQRKEEEKLIREEILNNMFN